MNSRVDVGGATRLYRWEDGKEGMMWMQQGEGTTAMLWALNARECAIGEQVSGRHDSDHTNGGRKNGAVW